MQFFFDFISPYAYVAWSQIHDIAAAHHREVEAVPVLFAAILNHHGQLGPAEIPAKRAYVIRDVLRSTTALGLPLSAPPSHPFNPLLALRVASIGGPQQEQVITALFDAIWGQGKGAEDAKAIRAALQAVGLDPEPLLQQAVTPDTKAELKQNTQAAIERGVFGVPSILVDDALFWGTDSLPHLERFLAHGDPHDPALLARWDALPASAQRKPS